MFPMLRFNALLSVAFCIALAWPAFSAEPPPGTTAPGATPSPENDDIDPATGLSRSTIVRPLTGVPAVPDPAAARRPAANARPHIALILPTTSEALGRLADAVRLGFVAAAEAGGKDALPVLVTAIDSEGPPLIEACRDAQARGAALVVAAITRDGATALAKSDCGRRALLTLNEPQPGTEISPSAFSVSLSIEHEARQAALLAVAHGLNSAIVIGSPSPLARRVQEAFEREWSRAAGELYGRIRFSGNAEDAPLIRERIAAAKPPDMVFLALDAAEARAVRPYVSGMLAVYATSLSVNPRAEAVVNVDLQGVRYVEMPWFVQPDHPAVMVYPPPHAGMSVEQERLYAFGIDAFRLALQLVKSDARTSLDGVTGRISLEGNVFVRTLVPVEVDGGRVIPLRAP